MNTDRDYDSDGNNIVPCPICLSAHCASKEGGKCPDEDEFVASMTPQQDKNQERKVKDLEFSVGGVYCRLQLTRPFLVKKWAFVWRGKVNGRYRWNLHLFPLHIHSHYL